VLFLFQHRKVFTDEQLWLSSLSCAKQNFYSCMLPSTSAHRPASVETAVDHKTLRSLYTAYRTISAVDNYCRSSMGGSVDFVSGLHSGTSDCIVGESDDPGVLRKRSSWVGEMTGVLENMMMSAGRRWQDAVVLGSDHAASVAKDMEHLDK